MEDFVTIITEYNRMCSTYKDCNGCPMKVNDDDICHRYIRNNPTYVHDVVVTWVENNPRRTILSELLEKYPNVRMNEQGFPQICAYELIGDKEMLFECNGNCLKCWNTEIKE